MPTNDRLCSIPPACLPAYALLLTRSLATHLPALLRMANEVGQLQAALEQAGLPSQQDHPLDSLEVRGWLS